MINGLLAPGSCSVVGAVGARAAAVTLSSECDSAVPLVEQLIDAASRFCENRRKLL